MILKGSQRGLGRNLANHLLNDQTNDHVEIHQIRGVAAQDVPGAFLEIEAMGNATPRGTKKPFYALSLSPPEHEDVAIIDFEEAIEAAENRLGLEDQPRVVIFHEKEGRRHAHVVWSRIDPEQVKAINISFDKECLTRLSRDLFVQHGWEMPSGLESYQSAKPTNFDHAEWMQQTRSGISRETHKIQVRAAWDLSDDLRSFEAALEDRGYMLANGRRGFVIVDMDSEIHSVPRMVGEKAKTVRERLGNPDHLRTVEQARDDIEQRKNAVMERQREELKHQQSRELAPFQQALDDLRNRQRADRALLRDWQRQREQAEETERANRLRGGLRGWIDRLTLRTARIAQQNQQEREAAQQRDKTERDELIRKHLQERRELAEKQKDAKKRHEREGGRLRAEQAVLLRLEHSPEAQRAMQHMSEKERARFVETMIEEERRKAEEEAERQRNLEEQLKDSIEQEKSQDRDMDHGPER